MPNSASATADSVPVAPSNLMSQDEYWQQWIKEQPEYAEGSGNVMKAPAHYGDVNYHIAKFFGSAPELRFDSAYEAYKANWENDYNNYLNDINQYNENKAVQSARAYDEYMSNTQYQRAYKDLEKAGLNPYMLIGSGSVPAASYSSSAKAETMKRKAKASSSTSSKDSGSNVRGRDFALILLAIARLAAAL